MDGEFYFEESNPKNVKITILVIILIIGGLIGGYFYYKNTSSLRLVKNIEYSVGEEVSTDPLDYIKNRNFDIEDLDLDISDIPVEDNKASKIGEYNFVVYYNNKPKKGKLTVVDKKPPVVETESITIGEGEEFELDELLTKCEDDSKPCNVSLKNQSDEDKFKTAGEYTFTLVVEDRAGNKTETDAKVIVKKGYKRENVKKQDLTIHHTDPSYDDWNKQMMIKFDEGIDEEKLDSDEKYNDLLELTSEDLSIYLPEEYSNSTITDTEILYVYNKYNYIIGFAVKVKLSSGNSIYLTK